MKKKYLRRSDNMRISKSTRSSVMATETSKASEVVEATKQVSANDEALVHIKAAIDILGKSGNKDAVTKDTIANLGVVMLDLKANK